MHFNGVPEIVHHFISKIIHKVYKNLNSKEMTHFKSWKWEHRHEEKNQAVYRWHSNNTGIRDITPHLTHSKKFALNFWVYKRSSTKEDWYQNGDACQYRQILESLIKNGMGQCIQLSLYIWGSQSLIENNTGIY